mgnify:CR=1 FL=1
MRDLVGARLQRGIAPRIAAKMQGGTGAEPGGDVKVQEVARNIDLRGLGGEVRHRAIVHVGP